MEQVKEHLGFSAKAQNEFKLTEKALLEVAKQVVEKAKQTDTYVVIADKDGNIKKIPAKDL